MHLHDIFPCFQSTVMVVLIPVHLAFILQTLSIIIRQDLFEFISIMDVLAKFALLLQHLLTSLGARQIFIDIFPFCLRSSVPILKSLLVWGHRRIGSSWSFRASILITSCSFRLRQGPTFSCWNINSFTQLLKDTGEMAKNLSYYQWAVSHQFLMSKGDAKKYGMCPNITCNLGAASHSINHIICLDF